MSLREKLRINATAGTVVPLHAVSSTGEADGTRALLDELEQISLAAAPTQERSSPATSSATTVGLDPAAGALSDDRVLHQINGNTFMSHAGDGVIRIYREACNAETGASTQTAMTEQDLNAELATHGFIRKFDGTRWMRVKPGTAWIGWRYRRSYPAGMGLWPDGGAPEGAYNLYRGFGVAPQRGDPGPMVNHIKMLCGGNTELAEYFLNWLAFCVQRPGSRPEVAVVLRGGQGTGKGTVAKAMLRIFGPHGMHVTQAKHFVGAFNGHLMLTIASN